jgi:transcription antitermination factor NusG
MANWFAVYTRPGCEKKVIEILTRKNIECYCPVVQSVRKVNENKKACLEPLFSSYVYVKMKENDLYKLKSINRIINVVYWLQKPVVIKDIEIEMIRRFINEHKNIQLEKTDVKTNEIVKITKAPVIEKEGSNVSIDYDEIRLTLPSLGYAMVTIVERRNNMSNIEILLNQKSYSEYVLE